MKDINDNNKNNKKEPIPTLFVEKNECCGCTACVNTCVKDAIEMKEDEEGFLYPYINEEKCIRCKQCIKVCPLK